MVSGPRCEASPISAPNRYGAATPPASWETAKNSAIAWPRSSSGKISLTVGYLIGAAIMFAGGVIAWFFGVNAEGQSLENIASPLSSKKVQVSAA